ncbi:hypothetical protein [Chryseobacterium sp.]|uniref:hypothetical protein n=1 Tax=Chryseobacterium sp. TaxID=1871047 RepID=UPI0024E203FA|nr:hypothetical protein [Chryseobacterium sp.]
MGTAYPKNVDKMVLTPRLIAWYGDATESLLFLSKLSNTPLKRYPNSFLVSFPL